MFLILFNLGILVNIICIFYTKMFLQLTILSNKIKKRPSIFEKMSHAWFTKVAFKSWSDQCSGRCFFSNLKVSSPHNYLLCFGSKKSASHSYREITYKWKLSKEIMEISFIFYQTKHLTSNTSIHKCCRTDNFLRKKKNV